MNEAPLARSASGIVFALAVAAAVALGGCGSGGGGGSAGAGQAAIPAGSGAGSGSGGGGTGGASATAFDEFAQLRSSISALATADQQARLDAFITAKAAGEEGFPLRSGTRAAFVWRGAPAAPPALAGSFNGWSPAALALARLGQTDVFFVEANLAGADRFEYKFVVDGDWRADPLNRKFSYDHGNSVVNMAGSGKSHLESIKAFTSTILGNARNLVIYLPPGYLDSPGQRYPVIYLQDGQNLFDPAGPWGGWDVGGTADRLIAAGEIKDLIAVGIDNLDRMNEYGHIPDCAGAGAWVGGRAPLYAQFIVNELKPAIDALYRTLPGRDDTAILGSSMGGLVSVWAAYAHPQVFKNVGGMSSTFDWGSFCAGGPTVIDIVQAAGKQDFKIYIDSGGVGSSNPGDDNWDVTEQMRQVLIAQTFTPNVDLLYTWDQNADHNEAAWRARFDRPLRFFFPR